MGRAGEGDNSKWDISRREAASLAKLKARGRLVGGGFLMVICLWRLAVSNGAQEMVLWFLFAAVALGIASMDTILKALGRG